MRSKASGRHQHALDKILSGEFAHGNNGGGNGRTCTLAVAAVFYGRPADFRLKFLRLLYLWVGPIPHDFKNNIFPMHVKMESL